MKEKRLDIKYKETIDGVSVEKIRYSVEKWQADDKYMGESFITFTVKSSKPIGFYVGDYCEYRGETYTLNYVPSVSQRGNIGDSGDSFVYESVKMDSVREELGRIIMLDITPTTGDYVPSKETNYTGSAQFQLYCGETSVNGKTRTPVCTLAGKIQANLDRAYPTKGWKVLVDTESTHEEAGEPVLNTHSDEKVLTFDNTTVSAALAEVKNTFDIDFAIKGRTIYIGYTFGSITGSGNDYYYFGYGKGYLSEDNQGKALFELKRTADSNQKIVTRLRALGSTKNIPYRYYNKKYNLSQSMFPTNLQLPDTFETPAVKALHNAERKAMYPWIRDVLGETNDAYIDKNDNCLETVEGLREDCMRWDGSNPDLKEIYPSIEEVTYKDLRGALCEDMEGNKGSTSFVNYLDAERVDEILEVGDNANTGDGILPESDSTRQTMSDAKVTLAANETQDSLSYMGTGYVSKEYTVMTIPSQYAGEYLISNSHLYFGASYSLGRHQSENITKTCGVAYKIKVYATPIGSDKESVICEYISDFKSISNRDEKDYETKVAHLPDSDAETPKVSKIELTTPSNIRIAFALVVNGLDYTYDQYTVSWRLGLPVYETAETDTEWTPALIWDLKGSASTLMKNPFQLYVKDMGFDFVAQFSTSDEPRIAMKTGMCVAREFKIGNNPERVKINKNGKTYNAWKLTLAKADDSGLKTYYPSEKFPLAAGDRFVILGIEMPDVYVEAASMKLLVEATKALAYVCDTKHDYEPSVDDIYLQRNYDRCEEEGDVTKSVYWKLASGMKFPFFGIREKEDETPSTFTMIIDTLSIREGEGMTPKVTIKLSEDFQQNTIQKLTRTVESITKGSIFNSTSNMGGGMSESSVRAVVSDYTNSRFLSKITDDTTAGLITFLKGLVSDGLITARQGVEFGEFISGYIGKGGRIDANGHGELESLTLRSFLAVPMLRYNRISVTDGESWNTNGFGVIEEVDTENKTITLHLEDDEYASVEQGDICRGIFQDLDSEYSTADADADDCGFATKKGFFTSYFTVVRLISSGKGECRFEYALRNESTPQPCRMMKFAQYGSFTNEQRMSSCYSSAIVHFYSQVMEHVNTWEISPMMVSLRFGWLEGFPVTLKNGNVVRLKDHGLYVPGNVYFGQTITQLDAASIADLKKQLEQYTIEVATAVDVITVDDAGNVIGGLYSLDAEGKKTDYRLSSAVFVKRGNEYLTEADKGADASSGTYRIYAYCDGCECVIDNSTIYITSIKNIKDGIAGTEDDLTFDYDAMREMTGLTVTVVADCEGIGSISKDYHVTVKHDPKPFINFVMDNQIANISYNTKTQKYVGSPYKIRVSAYKDNAKLPIVAMNGDTKVHIMNVKLSSCEGVKTWKITYSWDKKNNDVVLDVSVSNAGAASGRMLFTASYNYAGVSYEQNIVHSINIASDTNMYELVPSVSQVVASTNNSGDLVADTDKITCKVVCNSSDDGQYVMTADELTKRKMSVKYSLGDDATLLECPADGLSVLAEWSKIVFHLFFGNVEIDTQDVPVMLNGVDGSGVEYVFLLTTEDKEPTIYDDSDTEAFQAPDYCPYTDEAHTRQWTDEPTGVGINNRYEWVAQRKRQYGKWLQFSKATKWATHSIDGTSPYSLDLTNESSQVLCDQSGNVIGGYETTAIQLFHGASVMSVSDFNITITATNISYTLSGAVITPSAFASGKDSAQIAVKAELKTNTSVVLTAVYSITKNKAGKDGVIYSLQPSVSTFSKDSNGVWVTKSFYLYAKKTTGAGATEITTLSALEAEGLTLKYGSTTVTSSTLELVPSAICGNNTYADLYLYKGSVVIDRERINVVSDGERGEDGEGVEYIYKLTTKNKQPEVPDTPNPIDTDVKGEWTDNPQGVSAEYPYEWVSEHTKSGGTWGAYTPATIWAKWSFDGSSITSVSEYYHANNDGKNAPHKKKDVWWNNPTDAGFGAGNPYLWNYEVMHYSSGSSTETDPAVISVWSQDGRGIKNITEYYLATTESSGVTFNPSELGPWTETVQTVTSTNKYLWNVECVEYTDEKNEYTDPVIIGVYGDKGDPGRGILFTERQYNVGNSPVTNPSADDANWSKQSPETTDAKPYLWKRYKYHYTNSEVDAEWTYEYVGMKGERGIDGGGTEWIYHHTSVFIADDEWDDVNKYWSDNPQNWPSSNNDEYKQSPWTDDPQGVNEEYPYEWISQRKKSGGVWGSFTKPTLWAKWSKDGSNGKNGKYSKVFYTWTKDEKPTAPTETGISVNDSRITWCDTSERGLSYSFTGGGWISVNSDWVSVINGEYRKEPGISVGTTYENISIRATKPNQKVFIEIGIERPSIGDEIYITSDSVELASARGNQTAIAEMFLAEAKDGYMATVTYSRIDNTDSPRSCWYRILTDENLKCWACNAVVDGDNDTIISWGDVVMYTCDTNKQESIYILSDCEDDDIPIPTSNAYKDKYVPRLITDIWSIEAQYGIGARVLLEYNGAWRRYKCKKSVPDIKPKDANSNYWVGYSGTPDAYTEWSFEGLYSEGDYVLCEGHYYQCIKVIPNIRPYATESEFWTDARDWTDDPTGISEAFKFEYVSIRQKNNGLWGSYSKPVIWTKWAMDAEAVKGDPGYSLNPPVFYEAGNKYVFERLAGTDIVVRDVVIYPVGGEYYYYMVKNRTDNSEEKVTSVPGETGNNDWQQGSKYELLIADALLAANANIGGFRISGRKLVSVDDDKNPTEENANLVLDGVKGTIKAKKAEIEGKIVATEGEINNCTMNECTINETCNAGFMRYSANKLNGNIINCGFIDLGSIDTNAIGGTNIYLPSVSVGEFLKISIIYAVATRIVSPDFTIGINGTGTFHDFTNFPIGGQPYEATITMGRGVYYEFIGMNDGNWTRWICVNRNLPRV